MSHSGFQYVKSNAFLFSQLPFKNERNQLKHKWEKVGKQKKISDGLTITQCLWVGLVNSVNFTMTFCPHLQIPC